MSGPTNHLYGRWKEIEVMKKFEPDRESMNIIARKYKKKLIITRKKDHSFPQILRKKYKIQVVPTFPGTYFPQKLSSYDLQKINRLQEKLLQERGEEE